MTSSLLSLELPFKCIEKCERALNIEYVDSIFSDRCTKIKRKSSTFAMSKCECS